MKNKRILIPLILAFSILFNTACQGKGTSDVPSDSGSDLASEPGKTTEEITEENLNKEGFPIVKDTITLKIFGNQDQNQTDWDQMWFFQEYSELTNINLEYQQVPAQGFDERLNLIFAGNEDMPDIFFRSYINRQRAAQYGVSSKQLMALDSMLEEYAPNFNALMNDNDAIRQAVTASDGQIYALPELNFSASGLLNFKQFINKDWLENLNLEIPTTPEELKEVLIAFRDGDPNGNGEADEIPLGIREISSIYQLGGSWGLELQLDEPMNVIDGKLHYWIKDDAFKDYLMYLNDLYTEKLLWQNYYKADSRPEWRSNLANALFGAFYMPYSDVFISVEDQFTDFDPLTGPYGDQIWSAVNTGVGPGGFAISSTCEYPEAALRWVDYLYSEEGSIFYRYGREGETFYLGDDGIPRINDEILNDPDGFMTALGRYNLVPGGGGAHLIMDKTSGIVATDLVNEMSLRLLEFVPDKIYSKPSLGELEQERVNIISQDLVKYRDESVTKFIIGEWSFEQWDTYCDTLDQIGLEELQTIYQEAFDKVN